jgi:hypothetical protein
MSIRFLSRSSVDFTLPQTQNSAALLRILHYPPQPPLDESSEHAHGIGAHTEYVAGLMLTRHMLIRVVAGRCASPRLYVVSLLSPAQQVFTILWQQPGIQALEVRNTNGDWLPAPPLPGSFVVKYVVVYSWVCRADNKCSLGDMLARWTSASTWTFSLS